MPGFRSKFEAAVSTPEAPINAIAAAAFPGMDKRFMGAFPLCLLRVLRHLECPNGVEHHSRTLSARHISTRKLFILRQWPQHDGVLARIEWRLRRNFVSALCRFLHARRSEEHTSELQ